MLLTFIQWTGAELETVNSSWNNLILEDTTTVKYSAPSDSTQGHEHPLHLPASPGTKCKDVTGTRYKQLRLWKSWGNYLSTKYVLFKWTECILTFGYIYYKCMIFFSRIILGHIQTSRGKRRKDFQSHKTTPCTWTQMKLLHQAYLEELQRFTILHWRIWDSVELTIYLSYVSSTTLKSLVAVFSGHISQTSHKYTNIHPVCCRNTNSFKANTNWNVEFKVVSLCVTSKSIYALFLYLKNLLHSLQSTATSTLSNSAIKLLSK